MSSHGKRSLQPNVQWGTWTDKITSRGIKTRVVPVKRPRLESRSASPSKPAVLENEEAGQLDMMAMEEYSEYPSPSCNFTKVHVKNCVSVNNKLTPPIQLLSPRTTTCGNGYQNEMITCTVSWLENVSHPLVTVQLAIQKKLCGSAWIASDSRPNVQLVSGSHTPGTLFTKSRDGLAHTLNHHG